MSDEISLNKGWSLDAYIAHNEAMRSEMDRRYEQRFDSQQQAVLKAEAASERRFESINEFRATLSDQATKFASQEKVNDLMSRFDRLEGRGSGTDASWVKLVSVVGMVGVVIAVIAAIIKWG